MDGITNLNFLHAYTIISDNSCKNEYCIVKAEDNCSIENIGTFSLENVENCCNSLNSVKFENVKKCDKQSLAFIDNENEAYNIQKSNEVYPFEGCCIEIPEEVCKTSGINVTIQSNQTSQQLQYQDLNRLYSNRQAHICDVCNKAFKKKSNLKRHYRSHTGDNPYICNVCDARYPTHSRLKEHQTSHSGERPFMCNICNKTFARTSNLTRHLRTHNSEKAYKCDQCDSSFVEATRLKEHYLTHTGEKKYTCNLCDKKFLKKYNLKRHYRTHSGEHSHTCDTCGKHFSKRLYLLVHIKSHSKEEMPCGFQISNYPHTDEINGNVSIPDIPPVFETNSHKKCAIKDTEYSSNDEITSDNSEINFETFTFKNLDDKLYSCKQCNRHFIKEKSLNAHLEKHMLGKDSLKCSVCKTSFTHLSRLKEHFITHSGEKPFPCVVCGRKFGRNSNLLRHLLTHTGEKNHQCVICMKQYSNLNHLKEHLLIHNGVKPLQCDVCKKFFRHKLGLQRHYLIHTDEKPHKCDLCNKQFSRRNHLSYHYQSHGKMLPASHPPSPLDSMFFIPNRVEPRLTQIIKNLESRLSKLSPNSKRSAVIQKKLTLAQKKFKSHPRLSLSNPNTSTQNTAGTKSHQTKPEAIISSKNKVDKHNNAQLSAKKVLMNENKTVNQKAIQSS